MNKPEFVVKIEEYIAEKTKERLQADQLQADLRNERPGVAFNGTEKDLKALDLKIEKADKLFDHISDQIEGAKQQLEVELEKWIQLQRKKLEEEAADLEEQAEDIVSKTAEYQNKIKELHGMDVQIMFPFDGSKDRRLLHVANSKRRHAESVAAKIRKQFSKL